jgi:hypothetical protein
VYSVGLNELPIMRGMNSTKRQVSNRRFRRFPEQDSASHVSTVGIVLPNRPQRVSLLFG